jgi:tripartite ATP-independent transporter DctP family solute receptor
MKKIHLVGASLLVLANLAYAADYKFRLAHQAPKSDNHQVAAQRFADLVKERTNGAVEIATFPGGTLGNDQQVVNLVRGGTIDFGLAGSSFLSANVPQIAVLELPFIFRNTAHAYKVLDGKVGQGLLSKFDSQNLKGLSYFENGWRELSNNKRPVRTPDDVKGLKLRTTPNPYHIQAFQLLGANPSPLPISELYTALEQKAFDGQEHPLPAFYSAKFSEVQKFLTITNHIYSPTIAFMNKEKFDSLPANIQLAIADSARDAARYHRELNQRDASKILEELKKSGLQVIEQIDTAPFQKIVEPTHKSFAEKNGTELLNAIQAE